MNGLVAEGVAAGYNKNLIITDVSSHVEVGKVTAVVGPNGAGKSTFLKAVFGLLPNMTGTVTLDGVSIAHLEPHLIAKMGVAYVPQVDNVFPNLSVRENLEMGAFATQSPIREGMESVYELFPDLQLAQKRPAGQLSGGQRIMLALGRGLMARPKFLLLDEPTAGLSPSYASKVWSLIRQVADTSKGLLVVEQNVRLALAGADRVHVVMDGKDRVLDDASSMTEEGLGRIFLGLDS